MWPTRADGRISSMPSRIPLPARKIEISTIFLPSSFGAIIVAIGVSILTAVVGKSRHTSYASSKLISRSRFRNVLVLVSFERISVSLCWTRGWSMTWTLPAIAAAVVSPSGAVNGRAGMRRGGDRAHPRERRAGHADREQRVANERLALAVGD